MNSSTACNLSSTNAKRRQSNFTLAFFCFVIITALMFSCSENIFTTPYGNKTLSVDTLAYDHTIVSSVKNLNIPVSGNARTQNKAGRFNNLDTKFMIKFTNFNVVSSLPDSVYADIQAADVVLHVADYWGDEQTISFDISMLDNDTSRYWEDGSDVAVSFENAEGYTTPFGSFSASTDADSIYVPIDIDLAKDWYSKKDSFYVNNGFIVTKSDLSDGMMAFYSSDYTINTDLIPKLRLECSIYDTNDVYIQDSVFYIPCAGDLQYAESSSEIDDELFLMAQGNVYRSFVEFEGLRQDSLLGPTDLLNQAYLSFVVNDMNTVIGESDTLYLNARLFRTDYWESDSIQYTYTAYSPIFEAGIDTIKIDVSELIQYLIGNPKEMEHEGIFFYLNNEYNDFNHIIIDPAKTELDIIYTKVKDE
jgi:hypothetical protein